MTTGQCALPLVFSCSKVGLPLSACNPKRVEHKTNKLHSFLVVFEAQCQKLNLTHRQTERTREKERKTDREREIETDKQLLLLSLSCSTYAL